MNDCKYIVVNARATSAVATSLALCVCMALTVYLSFSGRTVTTVANARGAEIIIDAGHGGMDGGAVAADGTNEKDINLDIAKRLDALFTEKGCKTVMTRTDDSPDTGSETSVAGKKRYDINRRMLLMKSNPDALFISIHQNYFTESRYSGAQVFYSGNKAESERLADCIQKSIVSHLQPENTRQIKKSDSSVYLLYHAASTAVMVECGFLSNPDEAARLKDEDYRQSMAQAIFDGVNDYLDSEKSLISPTGG